MSNESLIYIGHTSDLENVIRKHENINENEYFTAQSEFAESPASTSNWKKD